MIFKAFFILIVSIIIGLRKEITKLSIDIYKRHHQVSKCKDWCNSEGFLIDFSAEEKSHCNSKCNKFAYVTPFADFICSVVCPYSKSFLDADCSSTEFCKYHKEVISIEVKEAVEKKWLQAIKKKIF
jgi:hypothetical protein